MDELLKKVAELLNSGDDTGCDGLVCVGYNEFHRLREEFAKHTGDWLGQVDPYISDDIIE